MTTVFVDNSVNTKINVMRVIDGQNHNTTNRPNVNALLINLIIL